jgi:hypothetical protein
MPLNLKPPLDSTADPCSANLVQIIWNLVMAAQGEADEHRYGCAGGAHHRSESAHIGHDNEGPLGRCGHLEG